MQKQDLWQKAKTLASKLYQSILEAIFPIYCVSCKKKGEIICMNCIGSASLATPPTQKWIYPIFDYRDPKIRKAIWAIKYKRGYLALKPIARIIYEEMIAELAYFELRDKDSKPVIIPIPLAPKRLRERGFNQAEMLTQEIQKLDINQIFEYSYKILRKPKDTVHQAKIKNKKQRLKNLAGTFSIQELANIKNQNFILIDDVATTGATLEEARKILLKNGAKSVLAFTIAH